MYNPRMNHEKIYYLDIGTGSGGKYITQDSPSLTRVGLDLQVFDLVSAKTQYGIEPILIDAQVDELRGLPFRDNSFEQIDIILPINSLLYSLAARGELLWKELHRVLIQNGKINVVIDNPAAGFQGVTLHGEREDIPDPALNVYMRAKEAGFEVDASLLDHEDLDRIGTATSKRLAPFLDQSHAQTLFYSITATKL